MTENEAIKRVKEFGLYHAIGDLPYSTPTVKAFEMAIKALDKIQQYRAIGTVEECRAAVEKQNAKLVCVRERGIHEKSMIKEYSCPQCGAPLNIADESNNFKTLKWIFCFTCGQKLDWSDYND